MIAVARRPKRCPVERCCTPVYSIDWLAQHVQLPHAICACGWVGVQHASHVAHQERHGHDISACRVTAWVRLKHVVIPLLLLDPGPPRWVAGRTQVFGEATEEAS